MSSLRPTAPYSLHTLERDTEPGWCGPGLVVVDTVRDVMTDGRFVSLNSGSLESYKCLDTTNSAWVTCTCRSRRPTARFTVRQRYNLAVIPLPGL